MNRLFVLFGLLLSLTTLTAQQRPVPPHFDNQAPEWARMLLDHDPNVRRIEVAYKAWYDVRPFEKNKYTQFYKRWMQWARPYMQADGSLVFPTTTAQMEAEQRLLENRQLERETAQQKGVAAAPWTFQGPKVHYFPDASAQSVDHTNIYSFDIYAADPNILYAGGEAGGVWKTTDKGLNWSLLTANVLHGAFGAVKINPENPDEAYACTDGKIIKTTDGGGAWNVVYTESGLWVNEMYIHQDSPNIVLAASDQGLLRSADGGANWVKTFPNKTWAVKARPADPNTIWSIRQLGATSEFMISTDGGQSFLPSLGGGWWQPTGNRQVTGAIIAPCPSSPNKIYAYLSGEGDGLGGYIGVFKSTDGGLSWANTNPNNAVGQPYAIPGHTNLMDADGVDWFWQGFYDQAIVVNPLNDEQLIAGGCSWFRSNDGGATWFGYGGYVSSGGISGDRHPDIQWTAAIGNELWIASDGGLVYSTNFGQSVEGRNNGISGAALWGFGSGWNEDILVGGRYHNGNMAFHESFPQGTYYAIGGAEAPTGYVNPGPERKIYHSDIGGDILNPGFGNGLGGFPVGTWPNESYAYFANSEMEWHPDCWNIVFLGKDNKLWRSTDGGATFTVLHEFPGTADRTVFDIEICRADPKRLYVSQWNGTDDIVHRSFDGGDTWTTCTALPLPNNNDRMKLAVSAENPDVLWVAVTYGSNGKKIYKTTDGGITWQNLTTTALNGLSISNIAAQYGTDGGLYLGTTQGTVFYRNNSMSDWQPYSDGLPFSAETNRLKPFYKTGMIRNGCWNAGVWEAPLFEPGSVQALAMADKLSGYCPTDTFYFDDHSVVLHAGASWSWQFEDAKTAVGADTRTPKVVFASAGDKQVWMTLTTPQGVFVDSLTVRVGDECETLLPETLPGNALSLDGVGDYATLSAPLNLQSNTATFTAWIKPAANQPPYAGVLLCRGGSTTAGLHFGENNELRYMWNDANWWWNSGVTPPADEWSHVALVIEPNQATIYLNGVPTTLSTTHGTEAFDAPLVLGSDPGWNDRFFKGLIDEVCVYSKALTIEQIRAEMHLARTHTNTAGLETYLQFNEAAGPAFDRVGNGFASLGGDAERTASTVAVGPGSSSQLALTQGGAFSFDGTGVTITLSPGAGTYPDGPAVLTRIDLAPDQSPGVDSLSRAYWVLHHFGPNPVFDEAASILFEQVGYVPSTASAQQYQLYMRAPRAEGDTWQLQDAGDELLSGPDGGVLFHDGNGVVAPAQFVLTRPMISPASEAALPAPVVRVWPNPVSGNGALHIQTNLSGQTTFRLYDAKGRAIRLAVFEREIALPLKALPEGVYFYSLEHEAVIKTGKVRVQSGF